MSAHLAPLQLRRLRAHELSDVEARAVAAHLADCSECQRSIDALDAEQRAFEAEIPFDRFTEGVLARSASFERPRAVLPGRRPLRFVAPALALAAALLLVVLRPGFGPDSRANRVKGTGAGVTLRIAAPGDGPQREAISEGIEALAPGERVRIGYRPGPHRYIAAISIDAQGVVTPLYPERGPALDADPEGGFLPDSLEFTGEGAERVIVVLGDRPFEVEQLSAAAAEAFASAGELDRLSELPLPAGTEQFHQTVLKP